MNQLAVVFNPFVMMGSGQRPRSASLRSCWMDFTSRLILCMALLVLLFGCSESGVLMIPGELTFQGASVPGELSFEPLDANGTSAGRAVSVVVPESGRFKAKLPAGNTQTQRYRITVRVAPPKMEPSGSAAQDFGVGVKTVPLIRDLSRGQTLYLAITM